MTLDTLVPVAGVAFAAGTLHVAVRRGARRFAQRLAARGGAREGGRPRWLDLSAFALATLIWLGAALLVTELVPALGSARALVVRLLDMSLMAPLVSWQGRPYSALDLLELPALLAALWIGGGLVTRSFAARLRGSRAGESGPADTVAFLARVVLTFLGSVVILQAWGIDVRSLAIAASVLGVGIGFGLQKLANDFVSGIVISVERPIQAGDFVDVGGLLGTVQRIGARSTWIRTRDDVSILVPNSRFLESQVVNWSHGDPTSRLEVPVGVAYGSDVSRVRSALLEAAADHPEILREPRPRVRFRRFGESSLDFSLLVWTRHPQRQHRLVSDLNFRIEASFARHGVRVPFPQRDLHVAWPRIERAAEAWLRHVAGDGVLPAAEPAPRPEAPLRPETALETDLGPRGWSDAEIEALVARMRGENGVAILDRRHLWNVHTRCFVGREAVAWLRRHLGLTHEEAVDVGRELVARGVAHHVLDEHDFEDAHFFYRFRADEPSVRRENQLEVHP